MRSYEGAAFFVDKYHNEILKVTLKVTIFQQNETPCFKEASSSFRQSRSTGNLKRGQDAVFF